MADISKITLPNGASYDFKDSAARNGLAGKAASSHTHSEYASKSKYGDTTIDVGRKSGTTVGSYSTAEGYNTTASGNYSHAEGRSTASNGYCSHAEGYYSVASGSDSHAEGYYSVASGSNSHAEGVRTTASGEVSHAEGYSSNLVADLIEDLSSSTSIDDIINAWNGTGNSGKFNLANGYHSHSEGDDCLALGMQSHAEGHYAIASGEASHAEGSSTIASSWGSHAEGVRTTASGQVSHAEGEMTTASGNNSHAGGQSSIASGYYTFAHGLNTQALHGSETAFGRNNKSNENTLFSVGDGTATVRHNAFEITTTGGKLHDKDIAVKDDIPTSLPANGGNADTVDNVHISCTNDATPNINWFAAFTNENNLRAIDPGRAYVGNAGLLKPTLIGTAEHCTYHTILDWANSVNGMGQAVIVQGSGYPSDIPVGDEGMVTVETDNENLRKVVTFKSYGSGRGTYRRNIWNGGWRWDWVDLFSEKPYVTGSATVAANSMTCTSNHGFTPSAVIWWDGNYSGVATSFSGTQFTIDKTSSVGRTINYLIFK